MFLSLLPFHPILLSPPPSLIGNPTIIHMRMLLKIPPESQDYSWQIQHGMLPHPYCHQHWGKSVCILFPFFTVLWSPVSPAYHLHVGSLLHYSLWYMITFPFLWLFTAIQSPWSLNFPFYGVFLHTLFTTMTPNIFMTLNCLPKEGTSLSLCWTS